MGEHDGLRESPQDAAAYADDDVYYRNAVTAADFDAADTLRILVPAMVMEMVVHRRMFQVLVSFLLFMVVVMSVVDGWSTELLMVAACLGMLILLPAIIAGIVLVGTWSVARSGATIEGWFGVSSFAIRQLAGNGKAAFDRRIPYSDVTSVREYRSVTLFRLRGWPRGPFVFDRREIPAEAYTRFFNATRPVHRRGSRGRR